MFVFERPFWSLAAELGTALAILALSRVFDRSASVPGAAHPAARAEATDGPGHAQASEAHDISLAKR